MKSRQLAKRFTTELKTSLTLEYLLYLPESYKKQDKKWPLMLFLHGAGEKGSDLSNVKRHGPPKLVEQGKSFPFILVSPQCPDDLTWYPDILGSLLDEIEKNYNVDLDREYVTGLSMGGYGTWKMAEEYPGRFAAIAPICGWSNADKVCKLKHIPIWVFHGKKDKVVPFDKSEILVNTLKNCGGNVRFTVYPNAAHDSWTETYNNPELYEWMLMQSLNNNK